jgi:hypothetical protein
MHGVKLLPWLKLSLLYFGMLCSIWWFSTNVVGLPISPIVRGQVVQEDP